MIPTLIVIGVLLVAVCAVGAVRASKLRRDNLAAAIAKHGFREEQPDQALVERLPGAPFDDPRARDGKITKVVAGVYRSRGFRAFDYSHNVPTAGQTRTSELFVVFVVDCRRAPRNSAAVDLPFELRSRLEAARGFSFRTAETNLVAWEDGRLAGWATQPDWLESRLDLLNDVADSLTGDQPR